MIVDDGFDDCCCCCCCCCCCLSWACNMLMLLMKSPPHSCCYRRYSILELLFIAAQCHGMVWSKQHPEFRDNLTQGMKCCIHRCASFVARILSKFDGISLVAAFKVVHVWSWWLVHYTCPHTHTPRTQHIRTRPLVKSASYKDSGITLSQIL